MSGAAAAAAQGQTRPTCGAHKPSWGWWAGGVSWWGGGWAPVSKERAPGLAGSGQRRLARPGATGPAGTARRGRSGGAAPRHRLGLARVRRRGGLLGCAPLSLPPGAPPLVLLGLGTPGGPRRPRRDELNCRVLPACLLAKTRCVERDGRLIWGVVCFHARQRKVSPESVKGRGQGVTCGAQT